MGFNTNKKRTVQIEIVFWATEQSYHLVIRTPGWFNIVTITQEEAEKTSRNHDIEIQKKTVLY